MDHPSNDTFQRTIVASSWRTTNGIAVAFPPCAVLFSVILDIFRSDPLAKLMALQRLDVLGTVGRTANDGMVNPSCSNETVQLNSVAVDDAVISPNKEGGLPTFLISRVRTLTEVLIALCGGNQSATLELMLESLAVVPISE